MMSDQNPKNGNIDEPTGTEFVGHEWDGIKELNTPLPRWWLWTFYASIAWSAVYVVLYPAWPLVEQATEGVLGWSSRGELASEMDAAQAARGEIFAQIGATDIDSLAQDPQLMGQAIAGGAAAFKQHCVQCHGAGAAGYEEFGYPNLNDDDWIWGGELAEIEYTLTHGIRWEGSDDTRITFMPGFDGIFEREEIDALVGHVVSLDGTGDSNPIGAQMYADNCASCHQATGEGDQAQGAPALNDAIWLYGDSEASIRQQILNPRHGVMPGWSDKLDPVTIRMLAAYVHTRGGGEVTDAEAENEPDTGIADEAQPEEIARVGWSNGER